MKKKEKKKEAKRNGRKKKRPRELFLYIYLNKQTKKRQSLPAPLAARARPFEKPITNACEKKVLREKKNEFIHII